MSQRFHEDFSRHGEVKGSSDRAFGMVFAAVFAVIGAFPLLDGAMPRFWSLAVAAAFLALALARPAWLAPLNRLWTRFGLLLHRIISPVVLGLTYIVAVFPVGLLMRACAKDPLNRKFEPEVASYWLERETAGPAPETMKDQF